MMLLLNFGTNVRHPVGTFCCKARKIASREGTIAMKPELRRME